MSVSVAKNFAILVAAVIAAGAIMYYGRDLPGIKQARQGFDV